MDGIAVDYMNRLLYYTNSGQDTINVISLKYMDRSKVVIGDNLDRPRDIVLHPRDGSVIFN